MKEKKILRLNLPPQKRSMYFYQKAAAVKRRIFESLVAEQQRLEPRIEFASQALSE